MQSSANKQSELIKIDNPFQKRLLLNNTCKQYLCIHVYTSTCK